ncbi:hypothetical protein GLW08_19175 [Pontibacillus yanchengensis]|uniref:Uncharacterized protein n=1 Tax=Pontibacillus yanchengensis TaxID=462910 RepID=A0ACC7VLA8_9BACI|nr:hypothetical protein [Pontibacillus yanchengensis]MYL55440.1 hypothetical protein [Pontibacillus yanchengensis]
MEKVEWNTIVYAIFNEQEEDLKDGKYNYRQYMRIIDKLEEVQNSQNAKILGDNNVYTQFYSDFKSDSQKIKNGFMDMLSNLILIDRIIVLSNINDLASFELTHLIKYCYKNNLELIFPYDAICNVAYPDYFNLFIDEMEVE